MSLYFFIEFLYFMGKPIVHSAEGCLTVFLTSGIKVLVINDKLFEKEVLFGNQKISDEDACSVEL